MIELIGELNTASALLQVAIDKYLGACSAIQSYYSQSTTLAGVPPALSDCVSNELLLVTSYVTNIKKAKSVISQARNCSAAVPIHSLPSEILTRIFHLVIGTPCCAKDNAYTEENTTFPKYPDFLSHVCARWRRIILDLPELWSHVDLLYHHSLGPGFVARAEACASRAGSVPLDIHIRMPASYSYSHEIELFDFLQSTAARARSLELAIPTTSDHIPEHLFESCFENCVPGALVELVITDHGRYTPDFIVANELSDDDTSSNPGGLCLLLSKTHFQDLLLSVKILRLDGLYPSWTSQAYHGLVELRLMGTKKFSITESDLYVIFKSSPGLRILQFSLYIAVEALEGVGTYMGPVFLKDLEVLDLGTLDYSQLDACLELLASGSKPLRLTIRHYNTMSLRAESAVTRFFNRSSITKLYLHDSGQRLSPEISLDMFPQLQVLILDGFRNKRKFRLSSNTHQNNSPPRSHPLEALYVLNSCFDLGCVLQLVQKCPIQSVVFWGSEVFCGEKYVRMDIVREKLSEFCSVVEHVPSGPTPVKDWV